MKQLLSFLFLAAVLFSCGHPPATSEPQETKAPDNAMPPVAAPEQEAPPLPEEQVPQTDFPPVSIYANRSYSDALQRELDARNDKRPRTTEVMTLMDAQLGEDSERMSFRDAKGRTHEFASWPYEDVLKYTDMDWGQQLDASEKGKRYRITYQLEAYWFDAGAEVLESPTISKMVPVR